ncbi:MAG: hypothetical protein K2L02_03580 [Clostridia bacterium]|nr:hypothetical protein [Clostridia bacterium]
MKRKIILLQVLLTLILSILCCFALFGCNSSEPPVPEVKDVTITALDGTSYGKTGALHKVNYNVPEGSKVATSVKIGDSFATVADYSYLDGGYIFYTAGEYTITVYASKDGMLGSASAKITVHDSEASVSDVNIRAAAGEAFGKVGALHVLTYAADAGCAIQVEIKKDGEPATDVEFNSVYNTLVFGSAGKYTVKVTASIGTGNDSAETEIEIGVMAEPSVTLSLDKSEVNEDEEVTLNHTVVYQSGDIRERESVSALYRTGASDEYREAREDTYTVKGDRFTPHIAGEWKVVYKAQGRGGAVGEAIASLKCNGVPAEISLSCNITERLRIQTNTATDLKYFVEGATDKYDVTYDVHGASGVIAEMGEGSSVRVTPTEVEYFTLTVIYTHKGDPSIQKKFDIDLYSVDSLGYSPVWGDEPFDMLDDVLTSMGHMLYFNATTRGGAQRELTSRNAKYEVIENNVTASSGGTGVEVLNAADDVNYPYVIVTNFDHNVAKGDFTLKMTLTDPVTGFSAVAKKKFNVLATGNGSAAKFIQNYVKTHSDYYTMGNMNFENLSSDSRHNMVLTKTGTIMQRSNPSWPLRDSNGAENSDFALMDFDQAATNCRLEFKFTLLGPNPGSGEVWLGIGMRTVNEGGWAGFFDLHLVNGKLDITNGLDKKPTLGNATTSNAAARPSAQNGTTMYVRIDRSVSSNRATYTVSVKTEGDANYVEYYRCSYTVSSDAGNPGAPVKQYQFTHRNGGGCYAVENVTITNT